MKRILIADDEVEIVESVKEMLSPYYDVDSATTGIEIFRCFSSKTYDGILIDVNFDSGINGLEISTKLRSKFKDLKILIFSATHYDKRIQDAAAEIGASFCEKPLRDIDFVRSILGE